MTSGNGEFDQVDGFTYFGRITSKTVVAVKVLKVEKPRPRVFFAFEKKLRRIRR